MKLIINGEEKQFASVSTLQSLIDHLGIKGDRVAVELNRDIVSRAKWTDTTLHEGDRLEIVHFVGGG
jgi:sulfur carrier protein